MDLLVYDDDDHRYVPWGVGLAALLLVAAVVGAVTFLLGRSAAGSEDIGAVSRPEAATAPSVFPSPSAAPSASPAADACSEALGAADAALERSQALAQRLAEHTRIMDQVLAQRLGAEQGVQRTLPVLTSAATDRRLFTEELETYEKARRDCPAGR